MENEASKILFQEDDEDYLDDPIRLLDFEEHIVFCGSESYLKNITIEDPGYVVNILLEDDEVRQKQSFLNLKELKKTGESSRYTSNNGNPLSKCRTCSVKLVDCHKFPEYYRNIYGSTNKTEYFNTEHNVIEIKDRKDEEEIEIIDLTEKEDVKYNNRYYNRIRVENEKINGKVKDDWNEFTRVDNSVGGKVKKQTYKTITKPLLSIQNESHIKTPRSELEQATDLIISTYTKLTDKAIQKLKSKIESCQNSKNVSHNLGNLLLLGSKSFIKNRDNLSQDSKYFEKVAKVTKDNINRNCKNFHHKKKNNKNSNKIKNIYTSEQISKTKIKIKKSSLKSKEIISTKNYYKGVEDEGCNINLSDINKKQYDSLKTLKKTQNSFTNEKQQNHCENTQERIQHKSYLYPLPSSPVLQKILTETKNSTSLFNRNNDADRLHGCKKELFCGDRIIPHYHKNTGLNHQNILSKIKANSKFPKRSKETIHSYDNKILKNSFDTTETLNMRPTVSQISNPSIHHRIDNYYIGDHNAIVTINKRQTKNNNTKFDISNISAIRSVRESQVTNKLPVNNEMILKSSTYASRDIIIENVNNIVLMNQNKKIYEQLEEERPRYLLPSNCIVQDTFIKNIFKYYDNSNLYTPPYI